MHAGPHPSPRCSSARPSSEVASIEPCAAATSSACELLCQARPPGRLPFQTPKYECSAASGFGRREKATSSRYQT
eukprot:9299047-Pyramimonas_sp.AAC.1